VHAHYHTLGIRPGASVDDIKRAYRQLAKEYHPDVNPDPSARLKFIEIQRAYKWLLENNSTVAFTYSTQYNKPPEARRNPDPAYRPRHQQYAHYKKVVKEEPKSEWLRKANTTANIVFLVFSVLIMVVPIHKYIEQWDLPEDQQRSFLFFAVPLAMGILFCSCGYYYWFVVKSDDR
jgi:hypothetical protein